VAGPSRRLPDLVVFPLPPAAVLVRQISAVTRRAKRPEEFGVPTAPVANAKIQKRRQQQQQQQQQFLSFLILDLGMDVSVCLRRLSIATVQPTFVPKTLAR
jgi:hypothetical protein